MTITEDFAQINLERAAEYISRHGWHQGDYYSYRATDAERLGLPPEESHPPACAIGAILATGPAEASMAGGVPQLAINTLAAHLGLTPGGAAHIGHWNDDEHRTAEDVILALKQAASVLKTLNTTAAE